MKALLEDLRRWLAADESIALATVVDSAGSSPRPLGSRMAVTASGHMIGSVSGGCVEGDLFRKAQEVLADRAPRRLRYGTVDDSGWEVGLACGGSIDVFIELFDDVHRRLLDALERDEPVGLATHLDGGAHTILWPDGRVDGDPAPAAELMELFPGPAAELRHSSEGDVFLEVFSPSSTLTIIGAVHIGRPLIAIAKVLGFHVRLVDARRAFATRERFPHADELIVAWPGEAMPARYLRPCDAVVILTHDPKFDVPALEVALRSPVGYVGLLGSPGTQKKRHAALREKGFNSEDLARIHGPVGLDLGGRRPAEIALAIAAEIVSQAKS
ncbi:MAG: XdhC family protein [Chloroflexota bacterium]